MNSARGWQRVRGLFHEALQRPRAERSGFLEQECAGDESLRSEVESLLAAHERAGGFLDRAPMPVLRGVLAAASLTPGVRLGVFEITGTLGAGGMGEVYRARDTRLGRDVAVKLLPSVLADDPDRRARLERESRLLAALNHPHIAAIHSVEEIDGRLALILELVEGPTLADRLATGPIPIAEALRIAGQLAEALEAAHGKGVVHRDLKPSNVKVTSDGAVKLLDFGLAKAKPTGIHEGDAPDVTSANADPTHDGVILGTGAYMSPEQARGQAVDKRTDVWAFGCVLYEMLTGRRAFSGETISDTIAAILDREPDWTALPPSLPPEVHRLVRRCLQKDPHRRIHDIADARVEIEEALDATSAPAASPTRAIWANRRMLAFFIVMLLVAGVVGGSLWILRQVRPVSAAIPLTQFTWTLPANLELDSAPVVSPDSQAVAFVGRDGSGSRLFVRSLASLEAVVIPGTEGAKQPFWSPDSRWIAYFSTGKLWKVALDGGGPPIKISDVADARGGTWSRSGTIVFAPRVIGSGLLRVSENGGKAEPATLLDESKGENAHWWPSFLPDGVHYLYFVRASVDGHRGVSIGSTDRPAERSRSLLFESESEAIYAPLDRAGVLLSVADGEIQARPFDPKSLTLSGAARKIGVPAGAKTPYHSTMLGASSDLLAHVRSPIPYGGQLLAVTRNGIEERRWPEFEVQNWIRVSPDGHRLARARVDGARGRVGLWIEDLERRVPTLVTTSAAAGVFPVWSPDGTRLAFGATRIEKPDLVIASADGSEVLATLSCPGLRCELTDWSPDGRLVINVAEGAARDVWTIEAKAGGTAQRLLAEPYTERDARLSPDGRWIAYVSEQTGRAEVVVQSLVGRRRRIPVSGSGGEQPVWRRDGAELFFVQPQTGALHSVSVRDDGAALTLAAVVTHSVPAISRHQGTDYDISPDGSRVYLVDRHPRPRPREVGIILGWRTLLR